MYLDVWVSCTMGLVCFVHSLGLSMGRGMCVHVPPVCMDSCTEFIVLLDMLVCMGVFQDQGHMSMHMYAPHPQEHISVYIVPLHALHVCA